MRYAFLLIVALLPFFVVAQTITVGETKSDKIEDKLTVKSQDGRQLVKISGLVNDVKNVQISVIGGPIKKSSEKVILNGGEQISINSLEYTVVKVLTQKEDTIIITFFKDENGKLEISTKLHKIKHVGFYFSTSYAPCIAYRNVNINEFQFSAYDELNRRKDEESAVFGNFGSVQAGVSFANSVLYVEAFSTKQGFSNYGHLDWQTGYRIADTGKRRYNTYSLTNSGLGLGYNYIGGQGRVKGILDVGIYYAFGLLGTKYENDTTITAKNDLRDMGIRPEVFGGKIGFGAYIKPNRFGCGIKIIPTLFYNFSTTGAGSIKTNFYNIGLTFGVYWNTMKK